MDMRISPAPLAGKLNAIPSKSDAHRLIICAALADRPTRLRLPCTSRDIEATCDCMRALGSVIEQKGEYLTVYPIKSVPEHPQLDCGESGSTLRFLLPLAAALSDSVSFTGRGRLPERPLEDLMEAMEAHGASFSAQKLPFETKGRLTAGDFSISGHVSSQYITGLLLAASVLPGESRIHLTSPLESAAYVDITLHALRRFGISVEETTDGWHIPAGQHFQAPGELRVEGDWSNAAFPLVAGLLGNGVTLHGLSLNSPQGDRAVVDVLKAYGADISIADDSIAIRPAPLHGIEVDMREIPDALPALAVVAALAKGETRFVNAGRLRLKESDRLTAVASLLNNLGAEVEELPEGLIVRGGKALTGGEVDGFGDHRIVMAAAIAASRAGGDVVIHGAEAVEKSYPQFFEHFCTLGGIAHVL